MAKAKHPLAIVLLPDVPSEAADLLEAQGHLLYTMSQAVQANLTRADAIVGGKCWRVHPTWWIKDGALSSHVKMMLKAATTAAYPEVKAKKGKSK